jgi:hypothetical protein
MKTNRILVYGFAILAAVAILLPVSRSVNHLRTYSIGNNAVVLLADGNPLPPPVPPSLTDSELVADGNPLPPPVPPSLTHSELVADGNPLPPPVPPSTSVMA